jgi:3-isopropylmalate/(R)-2-methylmalate dehydratase large subunit
MFHDSSGPRRLKPLLAELGAEIRHPDRIVVVTDHYLPARDDESRRIIQLTRDWVKEQGIQRFHDGEGICHVVLPQNAYLQPGMFCVGGDSHSPTGGAFGAYMFGVGATEMLGVLVTGQIWLRVPRTIRLQFNGQLPIGVTAKDIMLMLIGRFGLAGADYQAIEFCGSVIRAMPMQERMTLTNMSAELGAQTALIEPDATLFEYLQGTGKFHEAQIPSSWHDWRSDVDAVVSEHHQFDAALLSPMVAAPDSPANSKPIEHYAGTAIDVAYIGACTGAKLEDLRMAARVLRGRKVAASVDFRLAPASALDQSRAAEEGVLDVLLNAGATLLPTACGICAGYGEGRFEAGQVALSTTARNFKGRMGDASSEVYLASPYTVAASAIRGSICDPREFLQTRGQGSPD